MDFLENPFHILGATPQDNRRRIMELEQERNLSLNPNKRRQARSMLIHPRNRISAEMAWMPGISPMRAKEIVKILKSSTEDFYSVFNKLKRCMEIVDETGSERDLFGMDKLIPLSRANLIASGLSYMRDHSAYNVVEWISGRKPLSSRPTTVEWVLEIARAFEDINSDEVRITINEERKESGFPEISDFSVLKEEIQNRRDYYRQVITSVLDKLSNKERAAAVNEMVESTIDEDKRGLTLINDLIDKYYRGAVQDSLEKQQRVIEALDEKLRVVADVEDSDIVLTSTVNQLMEAVKNWDAVAQPIQVRKKIQGLRHEESYNVAGRVRELAVHLFNEYDKLGVSRQLINMILDMFAEVPEIVELINKDEEALNKIAEERARLAEVIEELENIKAQVETLRTAVDAKSPDSTLVPMANQLVHIIKNWDALVPPIEVNYSLSGVVRDLAFCLCNEYDKPDFALQLMITLQEVFAEVPQLAELLDNYRKVLEEHIRAQTERKRFENEEKDIKLLAERLREASDAKNSDTTLAPIVNQLIQAIKSWAAIAQSTQRIAGSQRLSDESSYRVALLVRELTLHLWNEHGKLDFALQLTNVLLELFSEIPEIGERLRDDLAVLNKIAMERARRMEEAKRQEEEWRRQITYEVEIGILFKNKLRISPDGIEWQGDQWDFDSINCLRWGGTKHSINGIPTGTTYTIIFRNDFNYASIESRNKTIYNNVIDRLWRAVGLRLLTEYLEGWREGKTYRFDSAVISDRGVELERKRFFSSNERVFCRWSELVIWNEPGTFCIGKNGERKVSVSLSYQYADNIHVIEAAIRMLLERGADRLSQLLIG